MMNRRLTGLWVFSVIGAAALQLANPGSGLVAVFSGLWLVIGGTALITIVSHSPEALAFLQHSLRANRASKSPEWDLHWFLEAANLFRYGKIRLAEAATERIPDPLLRRGTQLVLDGFRRNQVTMSLQRQIAEERERLRVPIDVLHSMAGYAPTLGMLGTLLGMVQMLFGMSAGNMDTIGSSMGFAMFTTVYGLVLANLVFKPLASKLEQSGRLRIARNNAQLQAILMLYDRQHASVIREAVAAQGAQFDELPTPAFWRPAISR